MRRGLSDGVGYGGVGTQGNTHLTEETKSLSRKHHSENFDFNIEHALDHLKVASHSAAKMKADGKSTKVPKEVYDALKSLEEGKQYGTLEENKDF